MERELTLNKGLSLFSNIRRLVLLLSGYRHIKPNNIGNRFNHGGMGNTGINMVIAFPRDLP